MATDRFKLVVPSERPAEDAAAIAAALWSSSGDWPLPGISEWKVGYKADRVIVLASIPWTKARRLHRVSLFRYEEYTIDVPQTEFAEEQLKQRWPSHLPMPTSEYLGPA